MHAGPVPSVCVPFAAEAWRADKRSKASTKSIDFMILPRFNNKTLF